MFIVTLEQELHTHTHTHIMDSHTHTHTHNEIREETTAIMVDGLNQNQF